MERVLLIRVCRRVRWTEIHDSAHMEKIADRGRVGWKAARTNRLRHPNLHGSHVRAYDHTRQLKGEQPPEVDDRDLQKVDEVQYMGNTFGKAAPLKKRRKN